mgnify:CR=1 FL=1
MNEKFKFFEKNEIFGDKIKTFPDKEMQCRKFLKTQMFTLILQAPEIFYKSKVTLKVS